MKPEKKFISLIGPAVSWNGSNYSWAKVTLNTAFPDLLPNQYILKKIGIAVARTYATVGDDIQAIPQRELNVSLENFNRDNPMVYIPNDGSDIDLKYNPVEGGVNVRLQFTAPYPYDNLRAATDAPLFALPYSYSGNFTFIFEQIDQLTR